MKSTGQRADILIETEDAGKIAIELQCADLSAREWRRRHRLYRSVEIRDLWLLGAHRLTLQRGLLTPADLERGMLRNCAPLLFFDPLGERLPLGWASPIPAEERAGSALSTRAAGRQGPGFPQVSLEAARIGRARWSRAPNIERSREKDFEADPRLWNWLKARYHVTAENLPSFFGIALPGAECLACSDRLWQACAYSLGLRPRPCGRAMVAG